jgi:predicted CoA-binding protein
MSATSSPAPATPAELARWQDPTVIEQLLAGLRSAAVYGCSNDPAKDSHEVAAHLQRHGVRIQPINPRGGSILGEPVRRTLAECEQPVDCVVCFRPTAEIPGIVDEAIACGIRCVWIQLGLLHPGAARAAERAGLTLIADRCIKLDYARWLLRGAP